VKRVLNLSHIAKEKLNFIYLLDIISLDSGKHSGSLKKRRERQNSEERMLTITEKSYEFKTCFTPVCYVDIMPSSYA
jgi:hypothetical protein